MVFDDCCKDLDARGYDRRRDDNDRFARDRPQRDHRDDYRAPDRDYTSRDRYATQAPDSRRDYSRSGPPSDRSGDLRDEIRRPAPRQAPPARRSLSPERRDLPRRPVEDRYLDAAPPRYQDDDFRGRPREDDLYRDRAPRRYDDPPRHDDRGRDSRCPQVLFCHKCFGGCVSLTVFAMCRVPLRVLQIVSR